MGRFKNFVIRDFAGLNEDENPDILLPNELSACINVWKHGNAIGTRPGIQRDSSDYDAAIGSGAVIHGLHEFRWGFDANRKLVAICGGVIHVADTTTLTKDASATVSNPGAGTANAGTSLWTFAVHKDTLFFAGGANGDTICRWDGNPANNVFGVTFNNAAGAAMDAKFIFEKWNYLFVNGMNGALVEDNPTICRYSALNDGTSWPAGNSFGGTSAIGGISSYGDEYTTGFGEYVDNAGDWLLMLTNKQIYPIAYTGSGLVPFQVTSAIANGCVSQRAFVNLGIDAGDCIYMSHQGIHSLRQSQNYGSGAKSFLSWKIRPTFANINQGRIRQSVSSYWPEEGIVVFAVPTGSNTYNDTLLVLDIKGHQEVTAENARWYVWQLAGGFNANVMTVARDSVTGQRFLYIGSTDGSVMRFNRSVFADNGTGYQAKFVTKHNDYEAPGATKGLGDLWIGIQPGGDYTPSLRFIFDYGRSASATRSLHMGNENVHWNEVRWDEVQWGSESITSRTKVYGTGQGDTIAFEFSHSTAGEPYRITTFNAQIQGVGETQGTQEAA